MNIAAIKMKLRKLLAGAPRISKQMLVVIAAAIMVAAGGVYLVNTVFLDNSALNGSKSVTTRSAGKGGSLIAAVATPPQKIRDLFHYADELNVLPRVELALPDTGDKKPDVIINTVAPSYGGDVQLRGIAKSGITKYAMILYNGKTQVLRVGESFGPYSIAKISDGMVILNSPSGPITLAQQQLPSLAKQPKELAGGGSVEK
ncbi:MAG: hypothetical protein WCP79_11325 [Bacillota bacterium]